MGRLNITDGPNKRMVNVSYMSTTVSQLYEKVGALLKLPVDELALEWNEKLLHKEDLSLDHRGLDSSDTVIVKRNGSQNYAEPIRTNGDTDNGTAHVSQRTGPAISDWAGPTIEEVEPEVEKTAGELAAQEGFSKEVQANWQQKEEKEKTHTFSADAASMEE